MKRLTDYEELKQTVIDENSYSTQENRKKDTSKQMILSEV